MGTGRPLDMMKEVPMVEVWPKSRPSRVTIDTSDFVVNVIDWGDIINKPTTFPPSFHLTFWSDIVGVPPIFRKFAYPGREALRAEPLHGDWQVEFLAYLEVVSDGQGGTFIYNPISLNDDDGVDNLRPDNVAGVSPGRWERTVNP